MYARTTSADPAAFAAACRVVGVVPDPSGWVHVTCPNCGKEPKRGQRHFAFNETFAKCMVCGWGSGLAGLARRLGAGGPACKPPVGTVPPPAAPRPLPLARWKADPEKWVRLFAAMPDKVSRWRAYRPLTPATIDRWQLGVGPLPDCRKCLHRRLIIPVRSEGKVVGFAGRAFCCPPDCDSAKWMMSRESEFTLFNAGSLTTGCTVVVCESRADAILCNQEWPAYVCVAMGSANAWRSEWTERLVAVKPELVLMWPDNDKVGYEGAARAANELLGAGVCARVRRWSEAAPPKADLGGFLMEELKVAGAA